MRKVLLFMMLPASILFSQILFAQDTASAFWKVNSVTTIPTLAADTGKVSGAKELTSNLDINMNTAYVDSQRLTVPGGSWPAENEQNNARYIQFSVTPNTGYNFLITQISMRIGSSGGTSMKANVYYSKDPAFNNPLALYSAGTNFLPSGSMIGISSTPNILLLNGDTLYIRIYPFYKSLSTGKYILLKNIFVGGTTTSFFQPPTLSTVGVNNIGSATAQSGGSISLQGGSAITQKGVVWSVTPNPTLATAAGFTTEGTGSADYVSTLVGLNSNTVYHVRAYATNNQGTGYGNDLQFATTLATTNYYNKAGQDVTMPASWGTNADGSGTAPIGFGNNAQVFNIINQGASMSADWVVSGTDSKVIVGDGINPLSFTIPAGHPLDGIVDVRANDTLIVQNSNGLTFGTLHQLATIMFDGTNAVLINYPNLGLLNNANLPNTGTVGITGSFNPGSTKVAASGSTLSFIGTSSQVLPTGFTYNILKIFNPNTSFTGNLKIDSILLLTENFGINPGDSLILNPGGELVLAANKYLTVSGVFETRSLDAMTISGNLVVNAGASFSVNANVSTGYLIPAGDYKPGSEIVILQGTPKLPAIVNGNVSWNSNRSAAFLNNLNNKIGGNLNVNAGTINNGTSTGRTLSIEGNLNIAGGTYVVGDFMPQITTVKGNVNIASGALYVECVADSSFLYVKGNINHTGGLLGEHSSSTTGVINFIGSNQTFSSVGLTGTGNNIKIGNDTTAPAVTFLSDIAIGNLLKIHNGSLTIAAGKRITLNKADLNNKSLVFKSDSTGTASLGPIPSTISNGNNVTVERYISSLNNPALRLLAPSINSTASIHDNWQVGAAGTATFITGSSAGLNGFDATTTGAVSMQTYNVDTTATTDIVPAWIDIPNTNTKKLEADSGYLVYIKGDRTLDINDSSLSNNTVLRTTGSLVTGTRTFNGLRPSVYNLITNPYASAINFSSIRASNPDLADRYIYWDPNIGSRGGYVVVNSDGTTTPSLPTINPGVNIQSGQAFFVRPLNTTSVVINEAHKSANNNYDVFRMNDGSIEKLDMSLFFVQASGKRLADGVTSKYQNNYSTAIGAEDALQLANFDEDVSIVSNGKYLAIEGRPLIDTTSIIQLNVTGLKERKYEWQFNPSNFSNANLKAFLKDNFASTLTPISLNTATTVSFVVTSDPLSKTANRFQVQFSASDIPAIACLGGNVTINSDTLGIAYQWQFSDGSDFVTLTENAIYASVNAPSLQLINPPASMYGYRYRCLVTTANGNIFSRIFTLQFTNTWTGASSKAWENPQNWSCYTVPTANTDAIINAGMVEVNANAACRSLKTKAGVSVTVKPGVVFNVAH